MKKNLPVGNIHKLFGKQLQKERNKRGLTTFALAKAWGVSRSYITLIENGRRLPSRKHIRKIASSLDIKTEIILGWYLKDITQKIKKSF